MKSYKIKKGPYEMKIAVLILAAGRSSRMGVAKQLLPIGETTLLGISIQNTLYSNADKVFCVLGSDLHAIKTSISEYNIESIFNPNYKNGLSTSIVAGIKHIMKQRFDATLIVLGDQPTIKANYLNKMIDTFISNNKSIIASQYKNTLGVPAILSHKHYKDLLDLKGDKGAKDFLNAKVNESIALENTNLIDIDTKKEYQNYLNSINFE